MVTMHEHRFNEDWKFRNNFNAALNLQNLFDIKYFEAAQNRLRVYPGAPRTVKFTLGWQF